MSQGVVGLIELLITPPGILVVLMVIGLMPGFYSRGIGKGLLAASVVLLYLCSIPLTIGWVAGLLEAPSSITMRDFTTPRAQAIVILGGGRREYAPEFALPGEDDDDVNSMTLERLRYGAWLAHKTQLPILVTGGLPDKDGPAEAYLMKRVLEEEFGQPVRWVEPDSRNTYENARFSSKLLQAEGIQTVYLVTQAYHIPRATWSFQQADMHVIPAPTGYISVPDDKLEFLDFIPRARAMDQLHLALHEIIGNIWYRLRY